MSNSDTNSDSDGSDSPPSKQAKLTKFKGAARYHTRFQKDWSAKYPCISAVSNNKHQFRCNICGRVASCGHQGEADVKRHLESDGHNKANKTMKSQRSIFHAFSHQHSLNDKVIRAEVKTAYMLAHHNIPLATADHLSPLFHEIFPDSEIAKAYSSARTKTSCMLNLAIAPFFQSSLVEIMKIQPYSLATDGSNNTGLEKMNPLTVRVFHLVNNKVETQLLDMCTSRGTSSATAAAIFDKVDSKLSDFNIPWRNCVAFGVDNCSVNLGNKNSIKTRAIEKNNSCYFMGCPCHLVHNIASRASDAFTKASKFEVEELCVDLYYWFDKSTKRKSDLETFCVFCDTSYKQILKHVNTRWLSLNTAVNRTLQIFPGVQSYFRSRSESQARFKRLRLLFNDPMTEIYLLVYQAVLPLFGNFNLFLQREYPCIHLVYDQMHIFLRKLLGKFVTVRIIKEAGVNLTAINYQELNHQLQDSSLFVGLLVRGKLFKLVDNGDIDATTSAKFFEAARLFYLKATYEALAKLPLSDDLLKNARFVDFNFKDNDSCTFSSVEFFANRYEEILHLSTPAELEKLQEEFIDYQLMDRSEISNSVWEDAIVRVHEDEPDEVTAYRMDVIWGYLSTCRMADGRQRFPRLSKVAQLVLVIPHSNASEERVFSMVRKNKTCFRPNLSVDGTLSSLITVKLANPESSQPCYKFEPTKEVLKKAKTAAMDYNRMHHKQH